MPRRLTRRKRIGVEFQEEHKRQLETGHCYFLETGYGNKLTDEVLDVMRRDWMLYRDEILSDWIQKMPGTRPWAWWFFEAPSLRRCQKYETVDDFIAGKPSQCVDLDMVIEGLPEWAKTSGKRNYFGMLAVTPGLCTYESEEEFLSRHHLLTKAEA